LKDKANLLKKQEEKREEVHYDKLIEQARFTSYKAIDKEYKLEELLQKEVEEKEELEKEALIEQKKKEEIKAERLKQIIKEKEIENQRNLAKLHAEEALEKIRQQAQKEIAEKRLLVMKKILEIKKKKEREKEKIKKQITDIRSKIADTINSSKKKGNQSLCVIKSKDNYCNARFAENENKLDDCKSDNYCYFCCDNEFGEFYALERENCYKSCGGNEI
jgi:hypothetical protein